MNPLKKLASQTAIYGLPTIVGRLLGNLITPLYTYTFTAEEFGINASAYAYVSFLLVILTYGMETAFFKFSQTEIDKQKVYTTSLISLTVSSSVFVLILCLFSESIAESAKFAGHSEYIVWFAFILGADAISAVPFARLRQQGKAKRFATIKAINIFVYVGLNLFFILFCKRIHESPDSSLKPIIDAIYNPEIGIGYIFISNLIASLITILLLLPEIIGIQFAFDVVLWKKMLRYALPLLIAGIAGMANETLDRILLTHMLPEKEAMAQTGIYSACYKVSIIMTLFIQTFRFAAEPFFFNQAKEGDSKKTMADVMKFFVIVCAFIFLAAMMNIEWIQYFAGSAEFRTGIKVVPILLMANLFLGVFINQSIWYKLSGQTHFGAFLTFFGAFITIVLNILWIPRYGYMGSAWATLICYASMMVISYFLGNKHYPVNYDLKRIFTYLGLSLTLYFIALLIQTESTAINLIINNLFLVGYILFAWKMEKQNFKKLT